MFHSRLTFTTFTAALAAVLVMSCDADSWGPDALSAGVDEESEQIERGRETYLDYCSGCHGALGDGQGPAARHLEPKPRDLRVGRIKFALVPSGKPPRDEDYLRVITNGLKGTAMPAFPFIPLDDRKALIAYIRTLNENERAKFPGAPVALPRDPYRKKPAKGVREGERLYHGLATCNSCHPSYVTKERVVEHTRSYDISITGFRPHMYQSETKDSDWGAPITPPDFLDDPVKAGGTKEDLVRVIAAGVGGTAMPNWATSLTPKQLWALAYYVEYLVELRGSPEGDALREELASQPDYQIKPPPPPPPPPPEPEEDASGQGGAAPEGSAAPGGSTSAPTQDPQPSKGSNP